jgi:hypothetical protein
VSIQHSFRDWRMINLSPAEKRACLRRDEWNRHNRRVAQAAMPKHGLDYEAMAAHRKGTALAMLESLAEWVRQYAPAAPEVKP